MPRHQDDLARVRDEGHRQGESFDLGLREAERRERDELLSRLEPAGGRGGAAYALPSSTWRLQQELARLSAFHQAVLHSRAWRLVQALRRPLGRAW